MRTLPYKIKDVVMVSKESDSMFSKVGIVRESLYDTSNYKYLIEIVGTDKMNGRYFNHDELQLIQSIDTLGDKDSSEYKNKMREFKYRNVSKDSEESDKNGSFVAMCHCNIALESIEALIKMMSNVVENGYGTTELDNAIEFLSKAMDEMEANTWKNDIYFEKYDKVEARDRSNFDFKGFSLNSEDIEDLGGLIQNPSIMSMISRNRQ